MKMKRKEFIKSIALGSVAIPAFKKGAHQRPVDGSSLRSQIGLASYTLRKFSLDRVIECMQTLGLANLALKSMHMPLEAKNADLEEIANKVSKSGLRLYGAGVISMKTAAEVENAFRYAIATGIETIIGVPNHDLLDLVNEKVIETNVKVAIHNHGPGDDLYPIPSVIMRKIRHLDKRVGICHDIGHTIRFGKDHLEETRACEDRLYDVHLKDVNEASADGHSVEIGRGIIDIPAFIELLEENEYQGVLGLEYEKDEDDPFSGLAESVGYTRGIIDMLSR